ncbi:MAG: hypothetical protein ABR541_07540 [Candidatus Dormibacteria bacterium]
MDRLVWRLAHRAGEVDVVEDGRVRGDDPALVALLENRLREPVTVFRRGTMRPRSGAPEGAIELQPGDSRYVVARVRALCDRETEFTMLGCSWEDG